MVNSKKIVTIACSNGDHFDECFKDVFDMDIINLSKPGHGNNCIASTLFEYMDQNENPDFVYLQFSGLGRLDTPFDRHFTVPGYKPQTKTNYANWIGSGGIYLSSWKDNDFIKKHFITQIELIKKSGGQILRSLQSIFSAIELCKNQKIDYCWSTFYDYLDPPNIRVRDNELYIHEWPRWIDRSNMITQSPLNLAYEMDRAPEDGVHFDQTVLKHYLTKHKGMFIK